MRSWALAGTDQDPHPHRGHVASAMATMPTLWGHEALKWALSQVSWEEQSQDRCPGPCLPNLSIKWTGAPAADGSPGRRGSEAFAPGRAQGSVVPRRLSSPSPGRLRVGAGPRGPAAHQSQQLLAWPHWPRVDEHKLLNPVPGEVPQSQGGRARCCGPQGQGSCEGRGGASS